MSKLSIFSSDHAVRIRYSVLGLTAAQPVIQPSGAESKRLVWMTRRVGKVLRTMSMTSANRAYVATVTCSRHSSGSIMRTISSIHSLPESMAMAHFTLTEPDPVPLPRDKSTSEWRLSIPRRLHSYRRAAVSGVNHSFRSEVLIVARQACVCKKPSFAYCCASNRERRRHRTRRVNSEESESPDCRGGRIAHFDGHSVANGG